MEWRINPNQKHTHRLIVNNQRLLSFVENEDDRRYYYTSPFMNVEYDYIYAKGLNEAKVDFEQMIIDYINESIDKYENILKDMDRYYE